MAIALLLSIVGLLLVVAFFEKPRPRHDEITWKDLDYRISKREWTRLYFGDWEIGELTKNDKQRIAATFGIPKKFLEPDIGMRNKLDLYNLPEKRHDDRRDIYAKQDLALDIEHALDEWDRETLDDQ